MNYRTWLLILYVVIVDIFEFATCMLSCLYRVEGVKGIVQLEEFFFAISWHAQILGVNPQYHIDQVWCHIFTILVLGKRGQLGQLEVQKEKAEVRQEFRRQKCVILFGGAGL